MCFYSWTVNGLLPQPSSLHPAESRHSSAAFSSSITVIVCVLSIVVNTVSWSIHSTVEIWDRVLLLSVSAMQIREHCQTLIIFFRFSSYRFTKWLVTNDLCEKPGTHIYFCTAQNLNLAEHMETKHKNQGGVFLSEGTKSSLICTQSWNVKKTKNTHTMLSQGYNVAVLWHTDLPLNTSLGRCDRLPVVLLFLHRTDRWWESEFPKTLLRIACWMFHNDHWLHLAISPSHCTLSGGSCSSLCCSERGDFLFSSPSAFIYLWRSSFTAAALFAETCCQSDSKNFLFSSSLTSPALKILDILQIRQSSFLVPVMQHLN